MESTFGSSPDIYTEDDHGRECRLDFYTEPYIFIQPIRFVLKHAKA